jgi:8-amino-7-oxononanoate synthase
MTALDSFLSEALGVIDKRGHRRALDSAAIAPRGKLRRSGRENLDFSSNDYLGLSCHPLLIERAREWTARMGTGSGASRLVTGTTEAHLSVENRIAAFKGTDAALLFASGWQANAAVLPALLSAAPGAAVFADRLVHASLHHGCAAAGAREIRFRHNDLDHLENLLETRGRSAPARIILTESVFSMDGDVADLPRLAELARRYDAFLFVDEAHATGVLGPGGAGLSVTVPGGVDLVMGTFSKAMGGFGAYVAGSRLLCDYLINTCSGFVYSTAPPPAVLGAIDAALDLVPTMDAERATLAALGEDLRDGLQRAGVDVGRSRSQIVPAIIGSAADAVALSGRLAEQGMIASAIRPPTVPPGTSRLRLALRVGHQSADIDCLLKAIEECR